MPFLLSGFSGGHSMQGIVPGTKSCIDSEPVGSSCCISTGTCQQKNMWLLIKAFQDWALRSLGGLLRGFRYLAMVLGAGGEKRPTFTNSALILWGTRGGCLDGFAGSRRSDHRTGAALPPLYFFFSNKAGRSSCSSRLRSRA